MKSVSFIIILFFAIAQASASSYITIYLQENGDAVFIGETDDNITLPTGLKIVNGDISGKTNALTNKQGSVWSFSFTQPESDITVFLPENAVLKSNTQGDISIKKEQISIQTRNTINLSYELNETSKEYLTTKTLIVLILIIAVIILLIYYFINYKKHSKKSAQKRKPASLQKNKHRLISHLLNDREKIILEKLKETGKIKQSQLRKLTEIPKASFSRHIQELEKKHLIKRSGDGKNKYVELN
ncbi:MAG: MarR family transcriptional regulator [Nanoarchaeota archaeon]